METVVKGCFFMDTCILHRGAPGLNEVVELGPNCSNIVGPQKSTSAKIRIGISHINPLIIKPNKVGISP